MNPTAEIIYPLSRGIPKTGQESIYRAKDDGEYEAGWWLGRLNANNRQRYISKTISGDVVVIDRATGLIWAGDGNDAGCHSGITDTWANCVDYCATLVFAGFVKWRLPNVKELASILDYGLSLPCIEQPPFSNTKLGRYWSSTTNPAGSTVAAFVEFTVGNVDYQLKTTSYYLRAVRGGL